MTIDDWTSPFMLAIYTGFLAVIIYFICIFMDEYHKEKK